MTEPMVIGLMRVKDEERWIGRSLTALLGVVDEAIVFDDHSEDATARIVAAVGGSRVTLIRSPFRGLDEARDKNLLLGVAAKRAMAARRECWAVMIDGDEVFAPGARDAVRSAIRSGDAAAYSVRVLYLWDSETTVRVDGVYGRFMRPSVWKIALGQRFVSRNPGGLHCGNVPRGMGRAPWCGAAVLHYGYMLREDRLRKWEWYKALDGASAVEDGYRHMVQGDVPEVPAEAVLRHAGPLRVVPLRGVLGDACGGAAGPDRD